MDITNIDSLTDEVLVVGESNKFHLTKEITSHLNKESRAACTMLLQSRTKKDISIYSIHDVVETDKRPCKLCLNSIAKDEEFELKSCCVCNRLNTEVDETFTRLKEDYFVNVKSKKWICEKCTELIED